MLEQSPESRSLNVSFKSLEGEVVFAAHGNYAPRHISLSFDLLDTDFCAEHRAEIESAISGFLCRFNGLLSEAELPQVGS